MKLDPNEKPGHFIDPIFGKIWLKDTAGLEQTADLRGRTCSKLTTWFEVDSQGRAWLCCPGWLPYSIGNVLTESIHDIWHGERATALRNQIITGDWRYCQHALCPSIVSDNLPFKVSNTVNVPDLPTKINFSNDESCNLACPSCRVQKIIFTNGAEYEKRKRINDILVKAFLTEQTTRYFEINVTGSGDAFASKIFRNMLFNIDGSLFPNCVINLQTNGTLLNQRNWNAISKIHQNLKLIKISFDAAHESTYNNIRVHGKWKQLVENCKQLEDKKGILPKLSVHYDYVVQADNYQEMTEFVEFVKENFPTFDAINFSLVTDWGTWSPAVYEEKCIWKPSHPEFEKFQSVISDPMFTDPKINMGNIRVRN